MIRNKNAWWLSVTVGKGNAVRMTQSPGAQQVEVFRGAQPKPVYSCRWVIRYDDFPMAIFHYDEVGKRLRTHQQIANIDLGFIE